MTQQDKIDNFKEIHLHLESMLDELDRMTSGNFMHNKNSVKFSVNVIIGRLKQLGL